MIEKTLLVSKRRIWNVDVSTGQPPDIVDFVLTNLLKGNRGVTVACVNPHSQVEAATNKNFLDALNNFDVTLPDGVGTVIAAKVLGICGINRFTGPDFFSAICSRLNTKENRHTYYFIGSTEAVLENIKKKMHEQFPYIEVIGTHSPPFISAEELADERTVEMINSAAPSFVWVGMTAPKQELWMRLCAEKLNAGVIAGIGAEFDYFAGTKNRPPLWIRKIGLQWLYRFIQEPARTWKRHFISMPVFITHILLERLKGRS